MKKEFTLTPLPDLNYGSVLDNGYLMIFSGFKTIERAYFEAIFKHFGKLHSFYTFEGYNISIVRFSTPGGCISALQSLRGQKINGSQISIFLDSTTTAELRQFCLVYRRQTNSELTLSDVQVIQPLSEEFDEAVTKIRYELFSFFNAPEEYSLPAVEEEDPKPSIQLNDAKIVESITATATDLTDSEVQDIISEILEFRKESLSEFIEAKKEKEKLRIIEEVREEVLQDLASNLKSRR